MSDLEFAKNMLSRGYTCAAYNGSQLLLSEKRGVAPLIEWLDGKVDLSGFSAADRVIGRGAAFLYVLLGAKDVFASVISETALELLLSHNVNVSYDKRVPSIINRAGTGPCPIESAVTDVDQPNEALIIIKETLKKLSKGE